MKKTLIRALSLILAFALILPVLASCGDDEFDFSEEKLSKYVKIDREDYTGYEITVDVKKPGALELEEKINQILAKHKSSTALNDGKSYAEGIITNGSTVYIRYRGYTLDENGGKVDISGASNLNQSASSLAIGSGSFISGFEVSLIGKNVSDSSRVENITSGIVKKTDIITADMMMMYPDGTNKKHTSVTISLSDPSLEKNYGTGFAEKVIGSKIGEKKNFSIPYGDEGSVTYMDFTVKSATRMTVTHDEGAYSLGDTVRISYKVSEEGKEDKIFTKKLTLTKPAIQAAFTTALQPLFFKLVEEGAGEVGKKIEGSVTDRGVTYSDLEVIGVVKEEDRPITIETYFPHDYQEKSLRNKTVLFDVYVESIVYYETPTLTEEFITEKLKLDAASLSSYEGEGLVEKYKSKVMSELLLAYEENVITFATDFVWDRLMERANIKKLPEDVVKKSYNSYYEELVNYYNTYSKYYSSIDEACVDYFKTESGKTAAQAITEIAEKEVTQKLIFYYIGREEGFMPTDEEYDTLYAKTVDDLMENYLASAGYDRDDYETEEEFLSETEAFRADIMENYIKKSQIKDIVIYDYVMPKIVNLATIHKN